VKKICEKRDNKTTMNTIQKQEQEILGPEQSCEMMQKVLRIGIVSLRLILKCM
jgi:hypothetical protein